MRPDSITLAIFEKYTPEELADTATKLVQALADQETAETEKKTSAPVFKERIAKHAADASALAKHYSKGGETAQIGCTIRYDVPTVGQKSYIRMDREETVEVHDMSLEERQETLQFPLTAAPPADAKPAPEPEPAAPEPPACQPLTFKDIKGIAATIARIPAEQRPPSITEMTARIACTMIVQGQMIGPDGRVETIDCQETAEKLAMEWMELAVDQILNPPPTQAEEVTRLCQYPGCILFSEHDGDHDVPTTENATPSATAEPEAQPQVKQKATRKRRGPAPPPEPPCQEPPQPPAGD